MATPARAFCLFRALLLISLSLASCVVSTDYAAPTPEQALPRLLAVLKDPNPEQRRTAAQSLGNIARKEAVPALMEALRDPDAGVRRHAAWALGMIGEEAAGPDRSPLASLLFDPDPGVRETAFRLGKFGGEAARPALTAALKDANADVRRLAKAALKELVGGGQA